MEENWIRGGYEILDICDRTIKINTTNFDSINYNKIYQTIETNLK
jgi:hypothetical protein